MVNWTLPELNPFCDGSTKDSVKRQKISYRLQENICKFYPGKGLVSRIYKEHLKLNNKKTENLIF